MKKVMLIGSLLVLCGLPGIYASDTTALQLSSRNTQLACVGGGATGTMAVVSATEDAEVARISSYQYADSFELSGEKQENAVIIFDKGYQVGELFRRESLIEKTYPCEKTFLRLELAIGNSSYAVYRLSVNTEEVGRLQLTDRFVDRSLALPHKTRFVMDHYDDDNLKTVGTQITFVIDRDGIERQVSSISNSSRPYEIRNTKRDETYMDNPSGGDNVRIYVRPDGREFRRNWEGIALVEKPVTKPAPVPAPVQQAPEIFVRGSFLRRLFCCCYAGIKPVTKREIPCREIVLFKDAKSD